VTQIKLYFSYPVEGAITHWGWREN